MGNTAATFSFLDKVFRRAHSPPRRGGVSATSKKWIRSDLSRTGWSVRRPFERPAELTTLEASRYRARAPRPPLRGGEYDAFKFRPNGNVIAIGCSVAALCFFVANSY